MLTWPVLPRSLSSSAFQVRTDAAYAPRSWWADRGYPHRQRVDDDVIRSTTVPRFAYALSFRWPLALILLLAILVRVIGLTFCLPLAQCRPDETTIAAVATGF